MRIFKIVKGRKGQSATEYMLVVAVIVVGIVSAASYFIPTFKDAVRQLSDNVATWLQKDQEMMDAQ